MDLIKFKECLSVFATGIVVVTTIDEMGMMWGITINSFNSVSINPFLILFSIEKSASRYTRFISCKKFVVNILSDDQAKISSIFIKYDRDSWNKIHYHENDLGLPIIKDSLAFLDCTLESLYDGGDHTIVIGRVINAQKLSDANPLLYFDHSYYNIGDKQK